MNPRIEEENIEDLLKGVYERIKEHRVKESKPKSKQKSQPYNVNPNPWRSGEGEVLNAILNDDGIWEVPGT